jgi:DNA ligase D-like protein (predicted ligase)
MSDIFSELPSWLKRKLRKSAQPDWVNPMLATLTDERFSREGWIYEPKFDGERCLAFKMGNEIALYSRNKLSLNRSYPELVKALSEQKTAEFIIDGEVVAFKGEVTSFEMLQGRMQSRGADNSLMESVPIYYYIFDIMYLDGYDLRNLPLRERKMLLKKALNYKDPLRFTTHIETEGVKYYKQACAKGWEGLIAKRFDSPYVSMRSRDWLKFKCVLEQELVIGGYTDPQGSRSDFGALLVGYYDKGKLHYAGKVGTGYNEQTLASIGAELRKLEQPESAFADLNKGKGIHWVKPKLVAEVGFTEWTDYGKLRHPRFLGLRRDKAASEVVREG